jgi:hypothetical protein
MMGTTASWEDGKRMRVQRSNAGNERLSTHPRSFFVVIEIISQKINKRADDRRGDLKRVNEVLIC